MEMIFTQANFEEKVLKADQKVLVDFWAPWCMPCRMMSPIIEEMAEDYEGKAYIGKVNVDEEMELAQRYKVFSIPTLLVFENGVEVAREVGVLSRESIEEMLME